MNSEKSVLAEARISKDPLLQLFQLRHLTLKNRIMSASHAILYQVDGAPQERYQLYHEEKAKGGLALTMFGGSSSVAPDSASTAGILNLASDSIIPHFQQFADRIHRYNCALMCQITHMGRRAKTRAGDWLPTVAPSRSREAIGDIPKVMDSDDIQRIAKSYGEAALRCKQGGLDGCEVVAQGHLIEQFWSPVSNWRKDEFGGSLENRLRFGLMVLEEIRRKVGNDFIVGLRMGMEQGFEGGLTKDDCLTIARTYEESGFIDFLNFNRGYLDTELGLIDLMPGMSAPLAPFLDMVREFRCEVRLPVFHSCRINDAATARHAIREGIVDMVGMTRAHLADPYIVEKIQSGQEDRIRPCVGATYCMDHRLCLHNPSTGREAFLPHRVQPSESLKRVVVVGGGPAGLEAARVCSLRGHHVTLLEATTRLGGQVALAARAGWRRDILGITHWLGEEIRHLGVDVRLSVYAEQETVQELEPDVVVIATGGLPDMEWLDGHEHCDNVWDVLGGSAKLKARILLYDDVGDHPAASCAEVVAEAATRVQFVFRGHLAAHRSGYFNYPVYLKHFYEKNIEMIPDRRLIKVEPTGPQLCATFENELTGMMEQRLADQVIVERGTIPFDDLFEELRGHSCNNGRVDMDRLLAGQPQRDVGGFKDGFELFKVGDAVSCRDIHCAILDSRRLCKDL